MRRKEALFRSLLCAMALLCFGLLQATAAACATFYVPDDYVTIQEGIKAARNGDTVIVRDGTYLMTSPVTFRGKAITLRSENGPERCIVDANGRSEVITFNCWETKDSVFSGFTITNGKPYFGSINCYYSSPTISNCIISGNTAEFAGGIWIETYSSPTITNCTIFGNTGGSGGAIQSLSSSVPIVTNCILWADSPNEITGDSAPVVSFSNIEGGWPGTMNIDTDPSFVDPAGGDYHLNGDSPCIDAGDNAAAALPETDMEGNPRIISGTVDMGPYEYGEHVLPLVRIEAVDAVASETGQDRGRCRVIRSRDASRDLTVRYSVAGTARNGRDYSKLTGSVTLLAGGSTGVIRVLPLDDSISEPEESVVLTLVESGSYEVGKERRARVVILDDD